MAKKILQKFKDKFFSKQAAAPEKTTRATRVSVIPLHEITYAQNTMGGSGARLAIWNISLSGLGLKPSKGMALPKKGDCLEGVICFPQGRFPLQIQVAHAAEHTIGCFFVGEFAQVKQEIGHYFQHEIAGMELAEVNREILKSESDGTPRLFRGRNNCELFMVENQGRVVRFQISLFGSYIEGGEALKTKFGFLAEAERDKPKYKGSSIVRLHGDVPAETLANVVVFLSHIPQLSAEQREIIALAVRHGAIQ